ncbi:uncharacterized protein BO96DRAFT_440189 [Aspergillus niger CBS 101883]|uniref:Uncharacterized protein n=2 Tax=Aspergillus niger TaxID=5061 RepID=A2QSK9_ASPNC|nr:uncharacterized protein BO96DRAFT_440189 [Aspergillus niger CBS 101883]XP_059604196.1 hypothetical protein An08g11100 [Aspergillus niger]PYH50143.1 hypothetical protein BO96DRAFT_440189 [Aspergillus niger CBS 101883]CAK45781.1 hypothetical protein An08g11100 [Aspergillus niger]
MKITSLLALIGSLAFLPTGFSSIGLNMTKHVATMPYKQVCVWTYKTRRYRVNLRRLNPELQLQNLFVTDRICRLHLATALNERGQHRWC